MICMFFQCMFLYFNICHFVGVVQLLNKMDGLPFNENDINLFEVSKLSCFDLGMFLLKLGPLYFYEVLKLITMS